MNSKKRICLFCSVSFEEFKEMFRQNNADLKSSIFLEADDPEEEVHDGLMGLDAVIPGGKHSADH